MARIALTANDTPSTPVQQKGGLAIITVKGTIGGGTITLEFQTSEMVADSDWATLTQSVGDVVAALEITTADRSVIVPLPASLIRATITGATSPNCRVFVSGAS